MSNQLIEEKVAHLTRMVEDLSDEVVRLSKDNDIAQRRIAMLMQRAGEAEADQSGTIPLADQRPPHW